MLSKKTRKVEKNFEKRGFFTGYQVVDTKVENLGLLKNVWEQAENKTKNTQKCCCEVRINEIKNTSEKVTFLQILQVRGRPLRTPALLKGV